MAPIHVFSPDNYLLGATMSCYKDWALWAVEVVVTNLSDSLTPSHDMRFLRDAPSYIDAYADIQLVRESSGFGNKILYKTDFLLVSSWSSSVQAR